MKCARKKRADFICPYGKLSDRVGAHEMRPKNEQISSAHAENFLTEWGA